MTRHLHFHTIVSLLLNFLCATISTYPISAQKFSQTHPQINFNIQVKNHHDEGFLPTTPIKTPYGPLPIEALSPGDSIIDHNNNLKLVRNINLNLISRYIKLVIDTHNIYTTCNQRFYIPADKRWIAAQKITTNHTLFTQDGKPCTIGHIEIINEPALAYVLNVEDHIFCATPFDLPVRNSDALIASTAVINLGYITIANPVTAIIGATIALAALTPTIYNAYIKQRVRNTYCAASIPPKVTASNADLIEHYYFVHRKKDLDTLWNLFHSKLFWNIIHGIC